MKNGIKLTEAAFNQLAIQFLGLGHFIQTKEHAAIYAYFQLFFLFIQCEELRQRGISLYATNAVTNIATNEQFPKWTFGSKHLNRMNECVGEAVNELVSLSFCLTPIHLFLKMCSVSAWYIYVCVDET